MQGQDTRRARLAQERQAGHTFGYNNPELTRDEAYSHYIRTTNSRGDAAAAWLNAFVRGRRAAKREI